MIEDARRIRINRLSIDPLSRLDLPIPVDVLRSHCNALESDDELLGFYEAAAIQWLENELDLTIAAREHRLTLYEFPQSLPYAIELPRGKTRAIDSVEYSSGGSTVTLYGPTSSASPLPTAGYQEDLFAESGGVLMPLTGSWPTSDTDVPAPVTINFTAGYTDEDLPADIAEAIMFAVSTLFELRGSPDLVVGGTVNPKYFDVVLVLLSSRRKHSFA